MAMPDRTAGDVDVDVDVDVDSDVDWSVKDVVAAVVVVGPSRARSGAVGPMCT
jgi:hypothetical protein